MLCLTHPFIPYPPPPSKRRQSKVLFIAALCHAVLPPPPLCHAVLPPPLMPCCTTPPPYAMLYYPPPLCHAVLPPPSAGKRRQSQGGLHISPSQDSLDSSSYLDGSSSSAFYSNSPAGSSSNLMALQHPSLGGGGAGGGSPTPMLLSSTQHPGVLRHAKSHGSLLSGLPLHPQQQQQQQPSALSPTRNSTPFAASASLPPAAAAAIAGGGGGSGSSGGGAGGISTSPPTASAARPPLSPTPSVLEGSIPPPSAAVGAAAAAGRLSGASGSDRGASGAAAPAPDSAVKEATASAAAPPAGSAAAVQGGEASGGGPSKVNTSSNNATTTTTVCGSKSSYVALHWLSKPKNVLVVRKMAPATEGSFETCIMWLRAHGFTVYVEPPVFEKLMKQLTVQDSTLSRDLALLSGMYSGSGSSGAGGRVTSSSSGVNGVAGKETAGAADGGGDHGGGMDSGEAGGVVLRLPGSVIGSGWLRSWAPEVEGEPYIPEAVASQLDLVVVLGGDGTVLWTCHIFGNRSVPPLVPFNLGSLGFLTPFVPTSVKGVLAKCLRGGFPIQLRHRLHCSIVRGLGAQEACGCVGSSGSSSSGRVTWDGLPKMNYKCADEAVWDGDEHVALNEVVLDRGSSPFLTNLECYCNGNFVTHVQVGQLGRGFGGLGRFPG